MVISRVAVVWAESDNKKLRVLFIFISHVLIGTTPFIKYQKYRHRPKIDLFEFQSIGIGRYLGIGTSLISMRFYYDQLDFRMNKMTTIVATCKCV